MRTWFVLAAALEVRLVKRNSQGEAGQFVKRSHRGLVRRSNVDHTGRN